MGGAIGVQRTGLDDADPIKVILDNEQKANKLFDEIARAVDPDKSTRINSVSHINIRNLFQYFLHEDHESQPEIVKGMNRDVICLAHKHCVEHIHDCQVKGEKRKAKRNKNHKDMRRRSWSKPDDYMSENIQRQDFKFLLACLYTYEHMYKIFNTLDKINNQDNRITRDEYSKGKAELLKIPYLTHVAQVTDERWEGEFTRIDCDNTGWINFEELCRYAMQIMVLQPVAFLESREENIVTSELDIEEEDEVKDEFHIGVCFSCAEQVNRLLEAEAQLEIAQVRAEYEEKSKVKDGQLTDSANFVDHTRQNFTMAEIGDHEFDTASPNAKRAVQARNMGVSFFQKDHVYAPIEITLIKTEE